jgi:hypothetical protein
MKKLCFLLIFPLLVLACANNSSGDFGFAKEMNSKPAMAPDIEEYALEEAENTSFDQSAQTPQTYEPKVDRKILRTVNTRFQTEDLNATMAYIEQLTKQHSGFISNMNYTNSYRELTNRMQVSIPAGNLDGFLEGLKSQSIYTDYTRINAQDVTEEFYDISTRLKTKKEVRDRYVEILRNRAQTVKDILNAEEKIRVIQEEIESIEGRLKFLNNRAAMSQVHLDVYQKIPFVKQPNRYKTSFFSKIKLSFGNGWELIQNLLIGLVAIWPLIIILGFLIYFRRRIFGSFRKK